MGGRVRVLGKLKIILTERFHSIGLQFVAQVLGSDGIAPVLHAATIHLLAAEVADNTPHIGAVLSLQRVEYCAEANNNQNPGKSNHKVGSIKMKPMIINPTMNFHTHLSHTP